MAFVVLQHLSPDFKSFMNELLSRRTRMAIRQAEHEMLGRTEHRLPAAADEGDDHPAAAAAPERPRSASGLTLPIDMFLRSLAQDLGERAVAVILSGSGSDGSRGIQEISQAGGTVFCESPDSAQFNGMPLSAIRTGDVDHVLPPEEIAAAVAALGAPARAGALDGRAGSEEPASRRSAAAARRIRHRLLALQGQHGHPPHRAAARAEPLARHRHVCRAAAQRSARAQLALRGSADRRDPVLPRRRRLRGARAPHHPRARGADQRRRQIRVWVPGCATGQEAYSIAMLCTSGSTRGAAGQPQAPRDRRPQGVARLASTGLYSEDRSTASTERLERFFTLKPEGYQISQTLRESIVFAPHNLIRDAPFTKMDLITCRNMLIYLQPHAQKTVLTLFHFSLKPGGFLFLGSSETPGGLLDEFDTIDEHAKIYRKRRDIGLPRDLKLPLPRSGDRAARAARCSGAAAVNPQLLGDLRSPARSLHAAGLPRRRARPAGRHVRRRRGAAQGQAAAAVADTCSISWTTSCGRCLSGALHRVRRDHRERPLSGGRDRRRRAPVRARRRAAARRHGTLTHILITLADADSRASAGAGAAVRRRPAAPLPASRGPPPCAALTARSDRGARGRAGVHEGASAGDDPGARGLQRGAAGDQRGAGGRERGAPEHERGAALGQRGDVHGQRRVPEEEHRAAGAQRRHRAPAERHRRRDAVPRSASCASASSRRASPRCSGSSRRTSAARCGPSPTICRTRP